MSFVLKPEACNVNLLPGGHWINLVGFEEPLLIWLLADASGKRERVVERLLTLPQFKVDAEE